MPYSIKYCLTSANYDDTDMTTKRVLTLFKSLLCLLLTGVLLSCSETPHQPLRIGTNLWPGYEPLYLAKHKQYWSENDVRLIEYPSATEVIRAFRNRSLEAACLTLDEVLLLRQYHIPAKVILVTDISNGGDVIMAKPGITTIKELKGKRIGVESSALGAYVITRALEINDMELDEVNIEHLSVDRHVSAYSNNLIDAIVTFDPFRTQLMSSGASEIFTSKEIPGEIVDVLVVHDSFIKSSPEQIQTVINGWFKALNDIKDNNNQSLEYLSKRLKIAPSEVASSYDGMILPDASENMKMLHGDKASLNNNLKRLNKIMVSEKLLEPDTDTSNILSSQFIHSL